MPALGGGNTCNGCKQTVFTNEEVTQMGKKWHKTCFCCDSCKKVLSLGSWRDHGGKPYCEPCHGKKFGAKGIGLGLGDTGESHKRSSETVNSPRASSPAVGRTASPAAANRAASPCGAKRAASPAPRAASPAPRAASPRPIFPGPRAASPRPTSPAPRGLRPSQLGAARAPSPSGRAPSPSAVRSPRAGGLGGGNACHACGKTVGAAEEVNQMGHRWHKTCFCCTTCNKVLQLGQWKDHGGKPYCEADHAKQFGAKGIGFGGTLGDTGEGAKKTGGTTVNLKPAGARAGSRSPSPAARKFR